MVFNKPHTTSESHLVNCFSAYNLVIPAPKGQAFHRGECCLTRRFQGSFHTRW